MKNKEHSLIPIWEKYPEIFSSEDTVIDAAAIVELISEIFITGDYYYYLIDILKQQLSHQHPQLCIIHGLATVPSHLQEIIDLIHSDDLPFVLEAEEHCYYKVLEIGIEHIKDLKTCYCFRMRVADGSYRLFHHQAIALITDKENKIVRSLNIHTDISHLTRTNNYIATVMGINGRTDFYQIDLSAKPKKDYSNCPLTKRELELLPFIAQGMSSIEIAKQLEISQLTVRVHRKNILRKTNTCNSSSLIKRCIELGLLLHAQIINLPLPDVLF
ncbi:LuxR C-terminal-related transcriptional regulator [Sphingobacterium athyrii]|uniref:Helix-turn-helix transcriptional regulator n=1 Tax=Sphingobacterium athyrii TaxID=2152717 RepID=A0A363NQ44_9SPHI|nr:LuxR C-terminal-related transcriptional regulator [Sphingobacterium athyrii]PUV22857.1 helix-turn-helix transcriptional regulator [Sphingobacterium athyrii]